MISAERPVRDGVAIAELAEEDVLTFLLQGITPFIER